LGRWEERLKGGEKDHPGRVKQFIRKLQKLYRDLTRIVLEGGRGAISPLTFKRVTSRLNPEE